MCLLFLYPKISNTLKRNARQSTETQCRRALSGSASADKQKRSVFRTFGSHEKREKIL